MPTSSQSLILQTTNGQLPTFFGRRVWRAEPPPGPEWSSSEYPMTTVQIRHNSIGYDNKRYKSGRKPQSLIRAGSAPELTCKVDFSSLPNLLKIRGLHGTVRYDLDDKYVSWKVNSIGPFYNRVNLRGHYPSAGKSTVGTLKYFHADRANDSIYNRDETSFVEDINRPEFRKQVHFHDQETRFASESNPSRSRTLNDTAFISVEENGGKLRMIRTNIEKADYFKLIQIKEQSDENMHHNEVPIFRLEICQATEVGCFRLVPTEPSDVGDFKLVPPQGYLADDFRLMPSPKVQGAFVILQSDTGNPGQYRPVMRNKDAQGEFRLVQAKIQHRPTTDVFMPREAWGNEMDFSEQQERFENFAFTDFKDKTIHDGSNEYGYNYFDGIRDQYSFDEKNIFPDINLYENKKSNVLHPKPETAQKYDETYMLDKDLRTFNQHLDEFNQRYQDSMRQLSSKDNKRSTVFDLRKSFDDKEDQENRPGKVAGARSSSKGLSSEWKTHNFDQWSRTSKRTLLEPLESMDTGITRTVQKIPPINNDQTESSQENDSQLDEVQFKANYKQWKKKKVANVHMRKILPPSDPNAVCIRLDEGDISHDELKSKLEKETSQKVVGLQFDPVSVHSIDPEAMSRWIVRFPESSICEEFSQNGIKINGIKIRVRKFDDVMKEEHEAYKLYKQLKDFTDKRSQKNRKDIKMPKVLRTMQTQTK